jgi:glycosyltransferase involved in cell wall biosynthesis
VVLVGPEDEDFKASELHQIENVHFLGPKKMEELPQYLMAFDVALNPQKLNEVTIGNYPRKIDEYLAMGKPTVATRTVAMEVFENYTYLAESKEKYVELIEIALEENTPEKEKEREAFARGHTWTNNVKEIYKKITFLLQQPK